MKNRRVFAGVLLMLIVFGCSEASAWWFGGPSETPLPGGGTKTPSETMTEVLSTVLSPKAGAVSTTTTRTPLPDGGIKTTSETVIKPSETGAMAGAVAGAALGAKIGTMVGGPAGTTIGAAVGGIIGGVAGWIFGPA